MKRKPGPDLFSSADSGAQALLRNVHFALFAVFFNQKKKRKKGNDFFLSQRLFIWNQTLIKAALRGIFRRVPVCPSHSQFVIGVRQTVPPNQRPERLVF